MISNRTLLLAGALQLGSFMVSAQSATAVANLADFTSKSNVDTKPNVLFIAVDDLRPQLECYGAEHMITPNIDALAQDSVLFERAYCQQAVCAPSRCSVLSGCRPDTTGIHDLETPLSKARPKLISLPKHFKDNGYETISIGKVYHHQQDDLPGWSQPPIHVVGDWKGRGYLAEESIALLGKTKSKRAQVISRKKDIGPAYEAADVPDEAYPDGAGVSRAIEELKRLSQKDSPFFLAVGFYKPHLPFTAPKKYWDMYKPQNLPSSPNPFRPKGVTSYSFAKGNELYAFVGMPMSGDIPKPIADKLIHGYHACVSYTDAQIGRLIQGLKDVGCWENTVIVLWGDHGWKLGDHKAWSKQTNYEIDTHVPLLVRIPGSKKIGSRSNAFVEYLDIYPTLCDAAGLDIPKHCEGDSLGPILRGEKESIKDAAYSQFPRGTAMGYAIRTDDYRYVEWVSRSSTKNVLARELYCHKENSLENKNEIKTAPREVVTALSNKLRTEFNLKKRAQTGKRSLPVVNN